MRVGLCVAAAGVFLFACGADREPWQSPISPPPPIRRTVEGTVREVNGGPVAAVEIRAAGQLTYGGRLASTASDGSFRVDEFAAEILWFRKSGYENAFWRVPQDARTDEKLTVGVKMQPALLLSTESALSSVITPDDMTYSYDDGWMMGDGLPFNCSPCKMITNMDAEPGAMLRLSWSGPTPLGIWAGQYYGGVHLVKAGQADQSEFVVAMPLAYAMDTILVGFGVNRDEPHRFNEPVRFTLAVETR